MLWIVDNSFRFTELHIDFPHLLTSHFPFSSHRHFLASLSPSTFFLQIFRSLPPLSFSFHFLPRLHFRHNLPSPSPFTFSRASSCNPRFLFASGSFSRSCRCLSSTKHPPSCVHFCLFLGTVAAFFLRITGFPEQLSPFSRKNRHSSAKSY